ncbi:MAG: amidohydrolase family protein [Acidobacteria bacterium]|nr:amidohydrolase family protein [Acidobacteriota bacterium]
MNDRINRTKHPGFVVALLLVLASAWSVTAALGQPPGETTVLRAARILDGRGAVLEDRDLVVRDGRIAEIVPRGDGRGDRVYDLTALTVLPGYIDTHVHIGNHFDDDGKVHRDENDPGVAHLTLHGAENAYRTLMNGITTMQSLGAPDDAELKAWIDRGEIPGPRLLSSLGAVRNDTGSPDEIRAYVRERAAAGADVIKVFASTSIRFGGVTNMTAAQLEAACGEARAQGLRSVVHLHRSDALRLTADAGCTQVEHGWMLEPGDVDVFVESGMYLGNQIDLLFRNYEERGDRYAGVGGYTLEGFANLQASRPGALAFFRAAAATPGVRIVYSTDANAGSHGANTDELVAYVEQGGQDPMDAVVSATSLAAESLGLEDRIGAIATGFEADIIALDGDPLTDPAALGRVVFVMRGGHVYRNDPPRAAERSTVQSRLSAAVRELVTPRGPEEQAAAIDFDILKTDTDLYADALARLPSAPRLPVDPTSQVGALGEARSLLRERNRLLEALDASTDATLRLLGRLP